jgi:uncharacterized protein YbjT (DUF2867 family)
VDRRDVFVTGGTGYLGRRLASRLLERGHRVRVLARPSSLGRIPPGCVPISGDALRRATFQAHVQRGDTFVQLVGVPHPSPSKARQFAPVDLVSVRESVAAARERGADHFVYVSVAQPAPVMKAFLEVRAQGESAVRESGIDATILRPWYVLGPGHRWPYLLIPGYWLAERFSPTRESARRLGLVTLEQMVRALVEAVEHPPSGVRVMTVPEIRAASA